MEQQTATTAITYRLDQFEGPLDLLLTLIQKNKVDITDIPIAIVCDQYIAYITEAQKMDMDIASDFLTMASELMLIKSKMLLPRNDEIEEDPRKDLADALLRYQMAKAAVTKLTPLYEQFSQRMVKDTDEISPDKTFVADQTLDDLCLAVRRIVATQEGRELQPTLVKPLISKPIVPVEIKIVGIMEHMEQNDEVTLEDLLEDSVSLPDMIAIFLGVLELISKQKLLIVENQDSFVTLHDTTTKFIVNPNPPQKEQPTTPSAEGTKIV